MAERGQDTEAKVLEVIQELLALPDSRLSIREITDRFVDLHKDDYDRKITAKWIGFILGKRLRVKTQKTHGTYAIPPTENPKLEQLFQKYGLLESKGNLDAVVQRDSNL